MLKQLFTSNTRVKILKIFLNNPESEYYIRELTRLLDEQINSVRRELNNLKKIGLLTFKTKSRRKYYSINQDFIIFKELQSIFTKTEDTNLVFTDKLKKLGNIDLLILSGSFTNQDTSVDLFIVGDLDKHTLETFLELNTTNPVKFTLMDQDDFLYRAKIQDRFIISILDNTKNIIAVDNLTENL